MLTGTKHRTVGVHSVTGHNWRPDLNFLWCVCGYCNGMEMAEAGFLFCNLCVGFGDILFRM